MSLPNAPFVRPLYGPADPRHVKPGRDVTAIKRALSRAGYLPWRNFHGMYDAETVAIVREFQKDNGIPATGHYGIRTHEALRHAKRKNTTEPAFDAAALDLLHRALKETHTDEASLAAARYVAAAAYWIAKRDLIAYAHASDPDVRPFPLVKPPALPKKTDCSGFYTTLMFAADAPDPNGVLYGREYSGYGYTGTLLGHGEKLGGCTSRADYEAGGGKRGLEGVRVPCAVFYGYTTVATPAFPVGSPTHVAAYIGGGYVASMGSDPGPLKLDADYRLINQVRLYPLLRT